MLAMAPPVSFHPGHLGAELVRLRTDSHLSQRALARLSDVSNTAISGLETGAAPAPHPSMLAKLAQGIATSGSGDVDTERAEAAYLRLMRAAGYVPDDPEPLPDQTLLRKLIERRVGNRANAELMQMVLDRATGRPPADQQAIIRLVDVLLETLPAPDP
jgi:transcriptional regulator with XRE-family HTH domain